MRGYRLSLETRERMKLAWADPGRKKRHLENQIKNKHPWRQSYGYRLNGQSV